MNAPSGAESFSWRTLKQDGNAPVALPGVCPGRLAGQMHDVADVAEARLGTSTWLALGAMALGVFVIANDFTALSVAIPRIEEQLHTTVSRAQWVINGYALVFGVLIVTGGRLADLLGRKRVFLAGAPVFGFAVPAAVHGKLLGFSALRAGAGLLPLMGAFALTSFAAGPLYNRLGPKTVVSAGVAFLAGGIFWLSNLTGGSAYSSLVAGMLVLGVGVGLFYSSITTAAVTALDPSQSSLAGGIVYMCQVAGGAIGLGLNTAIVLAAATLTDGIKVAFRLDAALAVIGLGVCLWFVHGPKRSAAHMASPPAHHRVRA